MPVLVDRSVWIDHLHRRDPNLVALLRSARVIMHSAVLGELACGKIAQRQEFLSLWSELPRAVEMSATEALNLIEGRRLWGRGLAWVDIHLIGSALLSRASIWTRDRVLRQSATQLRISFDVSMGSLTRTPQGHL